MGRWLAFPTALVALVPTGATAQTLTGQVPNLCPPGADGVLFRGQPEERITVGDGTRDSLTATETVELETRIACEDGRVVWASREDRRMVVLHSGGCFILFQAAVGGSHVVVLAEQVPEVRPPIPCPTQPDKPDFDYTEVLRIGLDHIIYRGRAIPVGETP